METEIKLGWIRFIDEMPEIGQDIIIAYSSSPYNGMSWPDYGQRIDDEFCVLSTKQGCPVLKLPMYSTEDFDLMKYAQYAYCYAHHWAYMTEGNNGIDVKKVCEYDRKMNGKDKHPIKCI